MLKRICIKIVVISVMIIVFVGYRYCIHGFFLGREATVNGNWEIMLVNNEHHIKKEYEPKCIKLSNGEYVDERIYPKLQSMFDDIRSKGISLFVRSGYRSWEEQNELWEEEMDRLAVEGVSTQEAEESGNLYVRKPGTSEHQTGLAVDINVMPGGDANTLYSWLKDNSYKYGFVLRYPQDKKKITGIMHEPWHFRYVGTDVADIMTKENLCLEEYLKKYRFKKK